MICTCPAYRLHFASSQMGYYYYICAKYIKCLKESQMYLSIYRLHHAKSQMGSMCGMYAMLRKICDMYLLSYTDYIMRNSQKGCIYMCRVYKNIM